MKNRVAFTFFLCMACAAVFFSVQPAAARQQISPESVEALTKTGSALADVAEMVKPSVVSIITTRAVESGGGPEGYNPFFNDPFFRRFFGDRFDDRHVPNQPKHREQGLGSGVIVDSSGIVLTNNHVIDKADEIKVILSDKREFKGRLIGADAKTDLAVVKIEADNLQSLDLGDSDRLRVGEVVIAVGNPYRLSLTVTMGIVSAKGRANMGIVDYEDFIQTDAAINPGNSGGAMVNARGELVGINTAIFSTSGGYQGIGFAIPSNMARMVMDQLLKRGEVVRGWLGVAIQPVTAELARQFGLASESGVIVSDVIAGSPAEKAGMKRGDVIISMNGSPVDQPNTLRNIVAAMPPGSRIGLKLVREGREQVLDVSLGELGKGPLASTGSPQASSEADNALRGVSVVELSDDLRARLRLPDNINGVVVSEVSGDSPADQVIGRGDVIMEINRRPVKNPADYRKIASSIAPGSQALLLVWQNGGIIYVTVANRQ
ncbi:MAG: DegQ family serine endoprotease [Nitrospirae bacterium]|nr:DegQ family serine endoprotease [Nitrospirota bacterium]